MKHLFLFGILLSGFISWGQSQIVYDTLFTSADTIHFYANPILEKGHNYSYRIETHDVQITNGDTTENKRKVDYLSFTSVGNDGNHPLFKLDVPTKLWKDVIIHIDSLEIPFDSMNLPDVIFKYNTILHTLELHNYEEVYSYVIDEWNKRKELYTSRIPNKKLYYFTPKELRQKKEVLGNWFSYTNHLQTIFDVNTFPWPVQENLKFSILSKSDDFEMSVHFFVQKSELENGNYKISYGEDKEKGLSAMEKLMEQAKQLQAEMDSTFIPEENKVLSNNTLYTILDNNYILEEYNSENFSKLLRPNKERTTTFRYKVFRIR